MSKQDVWDGLRGEPWWMYEEYEATDAVVATAECLWEELRSDREAYWRDYRLYDKDSAAKMQGNVASNDYTKPRLTFNVVRAVVNTVHAKITQSKPRPTYLTMGAGHDSRQKAKNTQAYSDGCLYHADAYDKAAELAQHALIFGTGCAATHDWLGRPAVEPFPLFQLIFERSDAANRRPRIIGRYRAESRDRLLGMFDGDEEATKLIEDADAAPRDLSLFANSRLADEVAVHEFWRKPSREGAEDGRHVVCLKNGTLIDRAWNRDPGQVILRWGVAPLGYLGYGISSQLRGIQYEINLLLLRISEQMIWGGPKIFLNRASAINQDDVNNEIMGIIQYSGEAPTYANIATVQPEMFQQLDRLYQKAFDEVGVSQLAARSEKPAGLNSGVAIRTYSDLESAKFVSFGQGYERLLRDISTQFLDLAADAENDDEFYKQVTYPTRRYRHRYLDQIKRSDIAIARDDRICQVFPTSALAQTPAARMEQVGDMSDRGWIDESEAVQLLDFPDTENAVSLKTAGIEAIDFAIDRMLEDGRPMRPEPWIPTQQALVRVGSALMRAQYSGVPEDHWKLLTIYLDALHKKQQDEQAAVAAAAPPPPGTPMQ